MSDPKTSNDPDRWAHGSGRTARDDQPNPEDLMPGERGPGTVVIPPMESSEPRGTPPSQAPGTVGAVGEMDFTGAPAGTTLGAGVSGGEPVGEAHGGGPGGGSMTSGGTGPAVPAKRGPQTPEATVDAL